MSAHLRFRIGPVVVSKRLEASKEKRSVEPVFWGAVLAFAAVMLLFWIAA